MGSTTSRRAFLAGSIALAGLPSTGSAAAAEQPEDFKLGVASYSLRKFSRAQAIQMIEQLRVRYVSVKSFHLPYEATPEELRAGSKEFADAGLIILSGGNISLQKPEELRPMFEYAKNCGMPMMVCAPTAKTLPAVEQLVKEFDIRIAVHNHGPEDQHFPTPQSALRLIKNMDPRMGLCIDVGHTARTGTDVLESIHEAGGRLFDMHIKDLKDFSRHATQCPVGEGKMPVVAIFKELKRMNYHAGVMLEYEIDANDPLPGMQRSFAYMRGVLAGLNG
jgi:sugar phosphate isomerase/epimerase